MLITILFTSFVLGLGLALMLSALHVTTFMSFLFVAQAACIASAVAGVALGLIAKDLTLADKLLSTAVAPMTSSITMLLIGLTRRASISKQKKLAPNVVRFLNAHFLQIASTKMVNGVPTITQELLRNAVENYRGSERELLQHIAANIREIGHQATCELVAMPMFHMPPGTGLIRPDGYLYETYEITQEDINTYVRRLSDKYFGW